MVWFCGGRFSILQRVCSIFISLRSVFREPSGLQVNTVFHGVLRQQTHCFSGSILNLGSLLNFFLSTHITENRWINTVLKLPRLSSDLVFKWNYRVQRLSCTLPAVCVASLRLTAYLEFIYSYMFFSVKTFKKLASLKVSCYYRRGKTLLS